MKPITRLFAALSILLLAADANAQCSAGFTASQTSSNVIAFTNTSQPIIPNSTSFMWDFGDQQNDYTQSPTHTYSVPGNYLVCLTMWDSLSGCQVSFCDTVNVTGNVLCNVSVSSYVTAAATCSTCADGSATAYMINGTAPYTFLWSNNSTTQSQSGLSPGVYTVCITDANGCTACDSVTVSYQAPCFAGFTWSQTTNNVIDFTNTSTPINANSTWFYWTFGDNGNDYTLNPSHTYFNPGTYTVCLTMYDSIGMCQSSFCDTIVVTGSVICNAAASAYQTLPATCSNCADGSASVTCFNMAWPYTYAWSNGDTTATISGLLPGLYSVCVTDSNGCVACSSVQITVGSQTCDANFSVYLDSVNTNQAWIYNMSSGSPNIQYQWWWGDNSPNDTTAYPQHVYTQTGTYTVCLIVIDPLLNCTDTMCQSLFVARYSQQSQIVPFYVNVIAPLGIETTNTTSSWSLFPNPAQEEISVSTSVLNSDNSFVVTDMTGRVVHQGPLLNSRIDISELDKGAYFFTITEKDGTVSTKMFIRN